MITIVFFLAIVIYLIKIHIHWSYLKNENQELEIFNTYYHYQWFRLTKKSADFDIVDFEIVLPYFIFDKDRILHPLNVISSIYWVAIGSLLLMVF